MIIHNPYKKYSKNQENQENQDNQDKQDTVPTKPAYEILRQAEPIAPLATQFNSSQHIKMSIRLPKGIVTSLTLKKNILSIWLLYTADTDVLDLTNILSYREANRTEDIKNFANVANTLITTFVYKCIDDWDKESGKGLSEFVTEKMIEDFLDDYELYSVVIGLI